MVYSLVQPDILNQANHDEASRVVRGWLVRAFWRAPNVWGASSPLSCHSSLSFK
jgi:hypothetical protein